MYPEQLVAPMRTDLSSAGFEELKTPEAVINHFEDHKGTTLLVINSVCGCAAGAARPGVKFALEASVCRSRSGSHCQGSGIYPALSSVFAFHCLI